VYPMNVHHIWFSNLNAVGSTRPYRSLFSGMVKSNRALRIFSRFFLGFAVFSILFSASPDRLVRPCSPPGIVPELSAGEEQKPVVPAALATMIAGMPAGLSVQRHCPAKQGKQHLQRPLRSTRAERPSHGGDRFVMWKAAFSMFLSNPLMGGVQAIIMATMREYIASGPCPRRILGF